MAPLQALPSSLKAYLKAFGVFLRHTTAREAILNCVTTSGSEAVSKWSNNNFEPCSTFRVLGVGSGAGKIDFVLLETIATQLQGNPDKLNEKQTKVEIFTRIIEPNPEEISAFKSSVSTALPPALVKRANVAFEWEIKCFQEYCRQNNQLNKFNFIHFVHSLYYMDAESALVHCYNKELGNTGVIFTLVQTANSYFPKMMQRFQDKLKFGPDDVFFYTTEELVLVAEKHEWTYECKAFPFTVDITKCFDSSSEEGDLLLDFVTHQESFRANADGELCETMMGYLTDMSHVDKSGCRCLNGEMGVVIIYKN